MRHGHRSMKGLVLCLACFFASGCGLLFVPQVTTIPGSGVHSVAVRDIDTKQTIANASVTLEITKWENWMPPPRGWWWYYRDGEQPKQDATGKRETLSAESVAPGMYELPSVRKLGWLQVWIPWPPVLGPWIYHTYVGTMVVSAEGYGTVMVTDASADKVPRLQKTRQGSQGARQPNLCIEEHILFIELPKNNGRNAPAPKG